MEARQAKRNQKSTDWALIEACRVGDDGAWETMIDRYQRWVYFVPRRYGLSEADAADIVQGTFITMMNSIKSFHEESNVKAWLGTVAKRQTWVHLKKQDRESVHQEEDVGDSLLLMGRAERPHNALDTADWLYDALQRMDEKCRKLILVLYFEPEKMQYEEIAERFGMRVGSIGPTRARCLKKLKSFLEETE